MALPTQSGTQRNPFWAVTEVKNDAVNSAT